MDFRSTLVRRARRGVSRVDPIAARVSRANGPFVAVHHDPKDSLSATCRCRSSGVSNRSIYTGIPLPGESGHVHYPIQGRCGGPPPGPP